MQNDSETQQSGGGPLDTLDEAGETANGALDQTGDTAGGAKEKVEGTVGGLTFGKKTGKSKMGEVGEGKEETLRLRIELDLDVELELKAKIKGSVTLALLD